MEGQTEPFGKGRMAAQRRSYVDFWGLLGVVCACLGAYYGTLGSRSMNQESRSVTPITGRLIHLWSIFSIASLLARLSERPSLMNPSHPDCTEPGGRTIEKAHANS